MSNGYPSPGMYPGQGIGQSPPQSMGPGENNRYQSYPQIQPGDKSHSHHVFPIVPSDNKGNGNGNSGPHGRNNIYPIDPKNCKPFDPKWPHGPKICFMIIHNNRPIA